MEVPIVKTSSERTNICCGECKYPANSQNVGNVPNTSMSTLVDYSLSSVISAADEVELCTIMAPKTHLEEKPQSKEYFGEIKPSDVLVNSKLRGFKPKIVSSWMSYPNSVSTPVPDAKNLSAEEGNKARPKVLEVELLQDKTCTNKTIHSEKTGRRKSPRRATDTKQPVTKQTANEEYTEVETPSGQPTDMEKPMTMRTEKSRRETAKEIAATVEMNMRQPKDSETSTFTEASEADSCSKKKSFKSRIGNAFASMFSCVRKTHDEEQGGKKSIFWGRKRHGDTINYFRDTQYHFDPRISYRQEEQNEATYSGDVADNFQDDAEHFESDDEEQKTRCSSKRAVLRRGRKAMIAASRSKPKTTASVKKTTKGNAKIKSTMNVKVRPTTKTNLKTLKPGRDIYAGRMRGGSKTAKAVRAAKVGYAADAPNAANAADYTKPTKFTKYSKCTHPVSGNGSSSKNTSRSLHNEKYILKSSKQLPIVKTPVQKVNKDKPVKKVKKTALWRE